MATEAVLSSLISEPGVSDVPAPTTSEQGVRLQPITDTPGARATIEKFSQSPSQLQQNAIPQTFLFGGMYDPTFQLRQPIRVRTERGAAGISVVWDEISEFGHGDTFSKAVEDFGRTLFELYKSLLADDVTLGPDLIGVRHKLDDYITIRPR